MCEPPVNWAAIVGGSAVFVGIASREQFDALALPAVDHRCGPAARAVLTKSIEQAGLMVVFQHWLDSDRARAADR